MDETHDSGSKRYLFIEFLRPIAAILILNSHFDSLYPISAMATGGSIGNSIFFAVSGFCLCPIKDNFTKWMGKRIAKLYVPTIIMALVSTMLSRGVQELNTFLEFIYTFIWPTNYWFVGAIALFYLLYYIFDFINSNKKFAVLFAIICIIYFIYYSFLDTSSWVIEANGISSVEGCFKLIYYFSIMMMGKWFRVNINYKFTHTKTYFSMAVLSFISIYAFKYLMTKYSVLFRFQFLNHVSTFLLIIFIFMLGLSLETSFKKISTKCLNLLKIIGNITLEMYLVQFIIIDLISKMEYLIFPINAFLALLLVFFMAYILKVLSKALIDAFTKNISCMCNNKMRG